MLEEGLCAMQLDTTSKTWYQMLARSISYNLPTLHRIPRMHTHTCDTIWAFFIYRVQVISQHGNMQYRYNTWQCIAHPITIWPCTGVYVCTYCYTIFIHTSEFWFLMRVIWHHNESTKKCVQPNKVIHVQMIKQKATFRPLLIWYTISVRDRQLN